MTHQCILQVEDEEADAILLQEVFKRVGIANPVQVVTDGQMAKDYLEGAGMFANRKQYPLPCLILLDLKLPKVSGLEMLAWLRQQPVLKKLPVVVFSSSRHPGDINRAYELGALSYVQKPSDLDGATEFARLFKAWWLRLNQFPQGEASQASD